jgi:hypothetical protein
VTAELVVVLPVLAAVTLALAWLLGLGVAQVRTVDAAREAARAVARGDDAGEAISRAQSVGPEGTVVTVQRAGDTVTARALARVAGPGGLFGRIAPVQLHAVAVAVAEDDGGAG